MFRSCIDIENNNCPSYNQLNNLNHFKIEYLTEIFKLMQYLCIDLDIFNNLKTVYETNYNFNDNIEMSTPKILKTVIDEVYKMMSKDRMYERQLNNIIKFLNPLYNSKLNRKVKILLHNASYNYNMITASKYNGYYRTIDSTTPNFCI